MEVRTKIEVKTKLKRQGKLGKRLQRENE